MEKVKFKLTPDLTKGILALSLGITAERALALGNKWREINQNCKGDTYNTRVICLCCEECESIEEVVFTCYSLGRIEVLNAVEEYNEEHPDGTEVKLPRIYDPVYIPEEVAGRKLHATLGISKERATELQNEIRESAKGRKIVSGEALQLAGALSENDSEFAYACYCIGYAARGRTKPKD